MGRTRTKSFEAIAIYLRDFAKGPQTATQISEGMNIVPDLPSLARSTIANCVTSEGASFYGITSVGVRGSSLLYYTYSEALSVAAKDAAAQEYANEVVKNIITGTVADKEAKAIEHLSSAGLDTALSQLESINQQLEELKAEKERYCRDDYERRLITSFRKARKAFDNEEALSLALSHSMATSVFVEGILPSLSDTKKPSVNKVLMGAQLLLSDFKGDSK